MKTLLVIFIFTFYQVAIALDQQDLTFIKKYGLVSSKVRLHDDSWGVNPSKIDADDYEYGLDQFRDLTSWDKLVPDRWLNFREWKKDRKLKDSRPRWRNLVRNAKSMEIVGRVIKCIGVCRYYHGLNSTSASYQTKIREGDEFYTDNHSYAWISLVDGTMVRVSPKTSITFTEVNISKKQVFYLARLNYGHINWQSRLSGEFKSLDKTESDLAFYPLLMKRANREYHAISEFRKLNYDEKLEFSVVNNPGYISQYKSLNAYLQSNKETYSKRDSTAYIYTPNASFQIANSHLSVFFSLRDKTVFKSKFTYEDFEKEDERVQSSKVLYRGYNNGDEFIPDRDKWYSVNSKGTEVRETNSNVESLNVIDSFSSRIPAIHLARERLLRIHSQKLLSPGISLKDMAKYFQYRLWDSEKENELSLRLSFIKEYIRRVETTNLRAIQQVFSEYPIERINNSYYARAMKLHYKAIRQQFSPENIAVREMTESEYYLWLLRNGK
jgi:hypothetical protein